MQTTALDLPGILAQHASFHRRLDEGEFDDTPDGTFDKALAEEQLRPIIQAIGVKGVGDLLHVAHELLIQVLKDHAEITLDRDFPIASDGDVNYVRHNFYNVMEWGVAASLMGML
jgi:hypothetical protein